MHWLDITLLVVLGLGLLLGAWSGLLWQVSRVVTLCAAVYAAIFGHPLVFTLIRPYLDWPDWLVTVTAFGIAFLTVALLLVGITWLIDRWLKSKKKLKLLDRLLGAGVGVVTMGLLAGAVLFAVAVFATDATKGVLAESTLAPPLLTVTRWAMVTVPDDTKKSWSDALDKVKEAALKKAEDVGKEAARDALPDVLKPPTTEKSHP